MIYFELDVLFIRVVYLLNCMYNYIYLLMFLNCMYIYNSLICVGIEFEGCSTLEKMLDFGLDPNLVNFH